MFILSDNINDAYDFSKYINNAKEQMEEDNELEIEAVNTLTSINNDNTIEGFTSNNLTKLNKYRVMSHNIIKNTKVHTPEECLKYCNDDSTEFVPHGTIIGAYYNSKGDVDNCKCYDSLLMANTGDSNDNVLLNDNIVYNHANTSTEKKRNTQPSLEDCNVYCQTDKNNRVTDEYKGYTYYPEKKTDNCSCHTGLDMHPEEGAISGITQNNEETDGDYEPMERYIDTSD